MENVMTKGFAELSATEMEEVDGGGAIALIGTVTACLVLGKTAFECGEKLGRTVYVLLH